MRTKATDALLADHQMINHLMKDWSPENPRFEHLTQTLHRTVVSHAWFEDQIFLPAMRAEPLIFSRFTDEVMKEHTDIDTLLGMLRKTTAEEMKERTCYALQLRVLLKTHFAKEEDALFPLAEKLLTEEGLIELGDEMHRRREDVRKFLTI